MSTTLWLGGSPCCGKSSVAELLADRHGMNYYRCDDHLDEHLQRAAALGKPVASVVQQRTHEFIFMRTHQENVQLVFDIYREEFEFILEDLASLPRPLIVEGCALLPDLLNGIGVAPGSALFMFPVEEFFRERYAERSWAWDRLEETSDPEQAFENWMRRDVAFAGRVAELAAECGYRFLRVDGSRSVEQNAATVVRRWGLPGFRVDGTSGR